MAEIRKIILHQEEVTTIKISEMIRLINHDKPRLFKINNMIDKDTFIKIFGDEELYYSYNGNSTILRGKTTMKKLLSTPNTKYIFSNVIGTSIYDKLNEYFPRFKDLIEYKISRIYCGSTGTGSHFHYHPPALNYLISGKKLWLILPPTKKNTHYYNTYAQYCTTDVLPLEWIDEKLPHLINNTNNVLMFTQEKGSVVYIPNSWYHFVVNLTDVVGITYSWNNIKKEN